MKKTNAMRELDKNKIKYEYNVTTVICLIHVYPSNIMIVNSYPYLAHTDTLP